MQPDSSIVVEPTAPVSPAINYVVRRTRNRRKQLTITIALLVAVIVLAVVLIWVLQRGGGQSSAAMAARNLSCGSGGVSVNEERLWAPWRLEYVTGKRVDRRTAAGADGVGGRRGPRAFFARRPRRTSRRLDADRRLLVADRGTNSIVVLNRYPYNNGHLLVAPRRHVGDLCDMTRDEHLECMEQLARLTRIYRELLNAEGFNIGLNLGRVAGAGLPGPFALASGAALGRRQQFHAGAGRNARHSAIARRACGRLLSRGAEE